MQALLAIKSTTQELNIEETEHFVKVSKCFRRLVRLSLLNPLDLLYTHTEESSKDISVFYADRQTQLMYFGRALKKQKHRGI